MKDQQLKQVSKQIDMNSDFSSENKVEKDVNNVHDSPILLESTISIEEDLDNARKLCEEAILLVANDATAYLEERTLDAFRLIKNESPNNYERYRTKLKQSNSQVRVGALDKLTSNNSTSESYQSSASELSAIASSRCELWHNSDGNAFATFVRTNAIGLSHEENWGVESSGFRDWLAWLSHTEMGFAPSSETIKTAQNTLAGQAKFDGNEFKTYKRVAIDENHDYLIDLCDEKWRAIRIGSNGWSIEEKPSTRFTRTKTMRPLIEPVTGSNIDELWDLVNIPEDERLLVLAWLLESLRYGTPYPVLELIGEQGSCKSTTQKVLRHFTDPNRVMLRSQPKSREDIFIAAANGHVVSMENLSGLSPEHSDALCTIATGGGIAGRTLYTNDEESIIEAHNPIILNGISAIITRPDLLDRAIVIICPNIKLRLTEEEHRQKLDIASPKIMGAIFDLYVATLRRLPNIIIPQSERPRMADFAQLGEAMSQVLGHEPMMFITCYTQHRRDAIRRTIDASPVGIACMRFVEDGRYHNGTVGELLDILAKDMDTRKIEKSDYWPRSARGMGDALRRIAPALRQIGIECYVEPKPQRDGVHCLLRNLRQDSLEITI